MKTYIALVLLTLFSAANFSELGKGYTINIFVNILKRDGSYDLFVDIRDSFGNEVSIETCHQMYGTNDCDEVVLNYMAKKNKKYLSFISFPDWNKINKYNNYLKLSSLLYKYKNRLKIQVDIEKILKALVTKFPDKFIKL